MGRGGGSRLPSEALPITVLVGGGDVPASDVASLTFDGRDAVLTLAMRKIAGKRRC